MAEAKMSKRSFKNLREFVQSIRNRKNEVNNISSEYDRELTDEELDMADLGRSYLTEAEMAEIYRQSKTAGEAQAVISYLNGERARQEILAREIQNIEVKKASENVVYESENNYAEKQDVIHPKKVKDVIFVMYANEKQMPVIELMYTAEDGMQYSTMHSPANRNDFKEILDSAGWIARNFGPQASEYIEPVIYNPKSDKFTNEFRGHENIEELITGYKLKESVALTDDIDYKEKFAQMYVQLSSCMASSVELSDKYNFKFFANDRELINPYFERDRYKRDLLRDYNRDCMKEEFPLMLNQEETKHR